MKKKSGITLIALVITIIVLLILAGVSLSLILGENGILSKAKEGVSEHQTGAVAEQIKLAYSGWKMHQYTNEEPKTAQEFLQENLRLVLKDNDLTVEETETGIYCVKCADGKEYIYNSLTDKAESVKKENEVIKTEDSITVRLVANNYKYNQFSLDGNNWTEKQTENVYTFNNLEKTVVTKSNYKTVTGKEYTVYCKSENDNGDVIVHKPIKVKLPVEVQADEFDQGFTYVEENGEISITGFNININKISSKGVNSYLEEDTIVVPSYINGKPVTKIDPRLLKAPNSYEGIENAHVLTDTGKDYDFGTMISASQKFTDINCVRRLEVSLPLSSSTMLMIGNPIDAGQTNSRYLYLGATKLIVSDKPNSQDPSEGVEGSVSRTTCTVFSSISIMPNLVLPPTIKEVLTTNVSSTSDLNDKEKVNRIAKVTSRIKIPDLRPPQVQLVLGFKGAKMIGDDYYFPIHVKILGKASKEEIKNIDEVIAINGENASEKIDFEVIN